ncbi:hypothetical protein ACQUQU_06095 [Thalassolituus sp. LLYu03]|uniref:hypothetical protein n=1 Tax=Thalassolituus sp. LLYu03 TaxID=3421656 RepID=UPI003D2C28B4
MKKIISLLILSAPFAAIADNVVSDDQIVTGSQCVGFDCANGLNFGFDTLILKENNVRILFDDTSSSGSFPSYDWRLEANDTNNGGANYFAISNATTSKTPFKIDGGAAANTLILNSSSNVGIGTSTPALKLQVTKGDTPAMRLEQDSSSGWSAYSWDIAGNETNFFVRDVTSSGKLPFRIYPGAGENNLVLKSGNIGIQTNSPAETIHVKVAGDAGVRLQNTTSGTASTWRIYNQADSGKLKITDDETGARTPFKMEQNASNNLMKVGTSVTVGGSATNSQVEVNGSLKATYLVSSDGKIYKLSDIVSALQALGQTLPTY